MEVPIETSSADMFQLPKRDVGWVVRYNDNVLTGGDVL
jgi:hypothetical protein